MPTLENKVSLPENVLFHEAADESVLLNLTSGKYYSLDDVGTRMFMLMIKHGLLQAAYQELLEEYEVDRQQLEGDLLALTDDLAKHGLLQILET